MYGKNEFLVEAPRRQENFTQSAQGMFNLNLNLQGYSVFFLKIQATIYVQSSFSYRFVTSAVPPIWVKATNVLVLSHSFTHR